jgi:hypothetical protein
MISRQDTSQGWARHLCESTNSLQDVACWIVVNSQFCCHSVILSNLIQVYGSWLIADERWEHMKVRGHHIYQYSLVSQVFTFMVMLF